MAAHTFRLMPWARTRKLSSPVMPTGPPLVSMFLKNFATSFHLHAPPYLTTHMHEFPLWTPSLLNTFLLLHKTTLYFKKSNVAMHKYPNHLGYSTDSNAR